MDNIPVEWAPVIARAWLNDEFKELLQSNPAEAFDQLGLKYEGEASKGFFVPDPPPNPSLASNLGIGVFKALPQTCTNTVFVAFKRGCYQANEEASERIYNRGAVAIDEMSIHDGVIKNELGDLYLMESVEPKTITIVTDNKKRVEVLSPSEWFKKLKN